MLKKSILLTLLLTAFFGMTRAGNNSQGEWEDAIQFTTPEQNTIIQNIGLENNRTLTQTINLSAGWNWISIHVEISLSDLQNALMDALPNTSITIKSQTDYIYYNGFRWRGNLNSLNVALMYQVKVVFDAEITLEGTPIDPTEHPITILPGANWIGFPLNENMSITNAFAGFAVSGDAVKRQVGNAANYSNGSWRPTSFTLIPGKGYIYKSGVTVARTFIYPAY